MSSISEQFSAAAKSQLAAQFNLLNAVASTAVGSAEKIIALTISTSRASLEQSSSAAKQLLETKDAQQFFNLSKSEAPSLDQLFAYGRQLFSIATDAQAELMSTAKEQIKGLSALASAPAPTVAAEPALVKPAPATPASAPAVAVSLAAVPTTTASVPATEAGAPKAVAKAAPKAKPAAEAVAKLSPAPAAPFPVPATQAAPVAAIKADLKTDIKADIKKPALKAVAAPKAKASTGPAIKAVPSKQLDLQGGKGKK